MLYKYILINSKDMSHIGELSQSHDKKLDIIHNKPGSAGFTYPMDADYSALIQPYKTGIKAMRFNNLASILAGRSVWDCLWSGYCLPIDEDVTNNKMTVSCVGWLQRLAKRFMRRDKQYLNVDDAVIVQNLLDEANLTMTPETVPYAVPVVAGSTPLTPTWLQWGGTQPNEGVGGATAYAPLTGGALRSKTFTKYTYFLSAIEEMMNIENGGDIVVDPLTRAVTWHRKYRRVKDDVVFGVRWGPHNVAGFGRNIEADSQVNYMVATGSPGTTPQFAHNVAQQAEIGLIEETAALSDVRDNNVLLAYAGAEIIVRAPGKITYSVTPFAYNPSEYGGVPEPFVAFRTGDQCRLTAVHPPRVDIRGQAIRVFGMSLSISDTGVGTLSALQVAP